jgi:hypothetical protein
MPSIQKQGIHRDNLRISPRNGTLATQDATGQKKCFVGTAEHKHEINAEPFHTARIHGDQAGLFEEILWYYP